MAQCKRHPEIETNLYCNKCGDPICGKCMVPTLVGSRCPSCAKVSQIPTFKVSGKYYLRALGAASGAALASGCIWAFIRIIPFFGFFNFLIGAAAGFGIGEIVSFASNRKRGKGLSVIVGIAVVAAYLVSILVPWGRSFYYFDIIAVIIGIVVAVSRVY